MRLFRLSSGHVSEQLAQAVVHPVQVISKVQEEPTALFVEHVHRRIMIANACCLCRKPSNARMIPGPHLL